MVAARDQLLGQRAALHAEHIGGATRMAEARQVASARVELDANQAAPGGQAQRMHGREVVKRQFVRRVRGVRPPALGGFVGGGDGEGERGPEGVGRPEQVASVHRLADPLDADAEIAAHGWRSGPSPRRAQPRASVDADRLAEHGADLPVDDQVGDRVEVGRLAVDDREAGAVLPGQRRKSGRRVDHQRGADREHQVAGERFGAGAVHLAFRHRLAEGDRGRLDVPAAEPAGGRLAVGFEGGPDRRELVAGAAGQAARIAPVAVQLDDPVRIDARLLVEVVDVLGDDAGRLAGAHQPGDRAVAAVGFGAGDVAVDDEFPPPRLAARVFGGDEVLEVDRRGLRPDPPTGCGSRGSPIRSRCRPR